MTFKAITEKVSLGLLIRLGALAALLFMLKSYLIAATVNGKIVPRYSVVHELEKGQGYQVLEGLITEALIMQEAKEMGILVTDEEIQAEIAAIETNLQSQGQNLDDALLLQNTSRKELEKQIKLQKIVDRAIGANISITDEEINAYIEENTEFIPEGLSEEEVKNQVTSQLRQQKYSEEFQAWIVGLKENANINYLVNYSSPAGY